MIEALRNFATSWVAKGLLVILVVSFAVWGVQLSAFGGSSVATIGDEEVSVLEFRREFNEVVSRINQSNFQRRQAPITPQEAVAAGLHFSVIAALQQEKALGQELAALGVDAPDEPVRRRIETTSRFQGAAGGFDSQVYEMELRQSGFRIPDFEERERRRLAIGLLTSSIGYGVSAPDALAQTLWLRRAESRRIGYLTFSLDEIAAPDDPGDEALRAHLEAHPERFTAPERRKIDLLWVRPSELAEIEAIEEREIQSAYEAAGAVYNAPERRNLERLDFDAREDAEAAAARIRAEAGPSLAQIAAEQSYEGEVALGYVTRAQIEAFTPEIAEAAFAEGAEGVVGPVASGGRFALINIAGVQPGRSVPLEEVRDQIAEALAIDAARRETGQLANAIEDSRAAGASFEELADQRGVSFVELDIDRNGRGPDGLRVAETPNDPTFFTRVFETVEGEESDLVQTADQQYWTAVVTQVEDARLRDFAEAREDLLADWIAEQKQDALAARAEAARERLADGEDLSALAEEYGVASATQESVTRFAGGALPPAALPAAFATSRESAVGSASVVDLGRDRMVLSVLSVETPDPSADDAALEAERAEASVELSRELRQLFETAVTMGMESELHRTVIQAAITDNAHGGM
ncbi:MAG: SurA N-terminal domain-containing protein [Pseudomonadota bacterium]